MTPVQTSIDEPEKRYEPSGFLHTRDKVHIMKLQPEEMTGLMDKCNFVDWSRGHYYAVIAKRA